MFNAHAPDRYEYVFPVYAALFTNMHAVHGQLNMNIWEYKNRQKIAQRKKNSPMIRMIALS